MDMQNTLPFASAREAQSPPRVRWFAENDAKARTERLALVYSPIWMLAVAAVMFSGALASWGEVEHLAFGLGLALPLFLLPILLPDASERALPLAERHGVRWAALLLVFSLLQNYFGARLFFERFGMEYHFHVNWIANGTPVFLYLMTVAYFATYYALMQVGWRAFRARFPSAPRAVSLLVRAALAYAMAFGETATMANRHLSGFFSYRDPTFVMIWGSFAYGTVFFLTLPFFAELDEKGTQADAARKKPLGKVMWDLLALNCVCFVTHEVWSFVLARVG
jgi:cycloeucalenol cycloisomerase